MEYIYFDESELESCIKTTKKKIDEGLLCTIDHIRDSYRLSIREIIPGIDPWCENKLGDKYIHGILFIGKYESPKDAGKIKSLFQKNGFNCVCMCNKNDYLEVVVHSFVFLRKDVDVSVNRGARKTC